HAAAINSLKRKGREDDPACIACHVTGYGQTGGYSLQDPAASGHLEGVQCEACHGPGHTACSDYTRRAPVKKKARAWKRTCLACHTAKESLNFSFARRYPDILHDSAPNFFQMGRAERLKLIRIVRRKKNLFANPAAYVGAEQCRKCHELQYDHWQSTKHAVTHTTPQALSAAGEMLFRYHTGVGHAGGYPEPGRAGVQCEACHGPGEKHLSNPTAKGHSYIVGLGAECPNCVVEQICRRCHELSDDPDFVFETHINSVRHTPAE
ncbi:MAG: hypothetical protein GY868_03230, partial [Deltaproteobacteria bacterium]|nr:hypothetical protein [Deltaproteobacteria bacterium]